MATRDELLKLPGVGPSIAAGLRKRPHTDRAGWVESAAATEEPAGARTEAIMNKDRRREVLRIVREQFLLNWQGIHGVPHWARVRWNGLNMAAVNGARADIVEIFAFLHDCQRHHDGRDREHGMRAADFTIALDRQLLKLDRPGLELLTYAVRYHSEGLTEADITVQTCWDADRLDLGRVGIVPRPDRLCTAEARDPVLLDLAYRRSVRRTRPGSSGEAGRW